MKVKAKIILYFPFKGSYTIAGMFPFIFSIAMIVSVIAVSLRMSGLDLVILGHSWGAQRMDPEGPHSLTAGCPVNMREIRLAIVVRGRRIHRRTQIVGKR